jgi:succinyl-CoA synthetase beta subunit
MLNMVRLHEYQGKQLLRNVGIAVPEGDVASTPEEAKKIAEKIGKPVAVKAQIWATHRFKANGIRFADNPIDAEKVAGFLLGAEILGFKVEKVLVEEKLDIEKEYYASVMVDDSYKVKAPVVMFSTTGGIDLEEVALKYPEKIAQIRVDIFHGVRTYDGYNLVLTLGTPTDLLESTCKVIRGIYQVFRRYDARVVEINPLVLTKDQKIVAADCRVSIDDFSIPRHPEIRIEVARETDRPTTELDRIASKIEEEDYRGICYFAQMVPVIEEKGYVGYHGIGGGGAILGIDALTRQGLKIANYAETSGNPTAAKVYRCAKCILSQSGIEGYLLGGFVIANQEQWHHAHGLVKAFREELSDKVGFPVVLLLAGNKEKEAHEIIIEGLKDLPIHLEIYGREHVYDTDFIAERMKTLIEEHRKERAKMNV